MAKWSIRLIGVSFAVCLTVGVVAGLLFAWLGHRDMWYALGTGLVIVGLVALAMGLLGATEPKEGWATSRGRIGGRGREGSVPGERQSMMARVGTDSQQMSSWEMVVWGVVVGGGLLLLGGGCFALAA